jgi:hypothetical protein
MPSSVMCDGEFSYYSASRHTIKAERRADSVAVEANAGVVWCRQCAKRIVCVRPRRNAESNWVLMTCGDRMVGLQAPACGLMWVGGSGSVGTWNDICLDLAENENLRQSDRVAVAQGLVEEISVNLYIR